MNILVRYELKNMFGRIRTYVFLALAVLFGALFTAYFNFYLTLVNFEFTSETVLTVLLPILPLITFDLFASERKSGYDQMLFSLKISDNAYYFAKFISVITVFSIHFVLFALNPVIISFFAAINARSCISALIGYYLTGTAVISVLLFVSAICGSGTVSLLASYGTMIFIYLIGYFRSALAGTAGIALTVLTLLIVLLTLVITGFSGSGAVGGIFAGVTGLAALITFFVSPAALQSVTFEILTALSPLTSKDGFDYGIMFLSSIVSLICFSAVFVFLTLNLRKKRKNG